MKLGRIVGSSFVLGTVVALAAACSSDPGADAAIEVAPPEARPGALKEVPRCDDSIPNGEETDTDCGGPTCGKCGMKMGCKAGSDCQSGVCIHGLCEGSLSANGQKDGQETDVDCGGPEAVACATGKACREDGDCEGSLCEAGVCGDRAPEPPAPASDDVIDTDSTPKALPGLGQAVNNQALPVAGQQFVAFTTKSCATNGAGRNTCGANGNESCCRTIQVPGGTFKRFNNNSLPATISSFKLDKYEVTQGRLRKFFQSKGGNLKGSPPAAGAGAHPKIANSGWRSAWNKRLPGSNAEIDGRLTWGCAFGSDNNNYGSTTWSSSANDNKPVTCVDWYTAFAFCAWDGGRLPTAAEWSYAAEGGSYQRAYAWGGSAPKYADANNQGYQRTVWYLKENGGGFDGWQMTWPSNKFWWDGNDGPLHIAPPGSKPAGAARWGHMDMSGNLLEWVLDRNDTPAGTCSDCANVSFPNLSASENSAYPLKADGTAAWASDGNRVLVDGSWEGHAIQNSHRYANYPVWRTYARAGFRCARN